MTNEEKADILSHEIAQEYDSKEFAAYEAAMEMAQWKEQQMIDWFRKNINKPFKEGGYITYKPIKGLHEDVEVYCASERLINDLIKAMKGE